MFEYPQTIFIFLMALCFLGLLAFESSRRPRTLLLTGLCFGTAVLSVPTVLVFLPFVFLWLVLKVHPKAHIIGGSLILLLGVLTPIAPWAMRNYVAYGHVILVNAAGGMNFWMANNETYLAQGKAAIALAQGEKPDPNARFWNEVTEVKQMVKPLGPVESFLEQDRIAWQRGLAFIQEDPVRFVKLTARKLLQFWSPFPDAVSKNGQMSATRKFISIATYGPLLLLALLGLLLAARDWRRFMLVYAYIGSLMFAYALFLPSTRYRLPLDFFLVIFAAYAVYRTLKTLEGSVYGIPNHSASRWKPES
jgi:hypothetical protein